MIPFIYVAENGQLHGGGQVQPDLIDALQPPTGCKVVPGVDAQAVDGNYFDFASGKVVSAGRPPSPHHVFDYATKTWTDPRTPETQWPVVRSQRDALLAQSDWTQLPDVPLATKERWAIYRQALRDVTLQPDPFRVVWPVAPG